FCDMPVKEGADHRSGNMHIAPLRLGGPYPDSARSPVSKIDALASDLMHQRGAFAVGAGPKRPGLYKNSSIRENIGPEVSQAMKLAPAIGQIFEEYRDIVIGRLMRIAARTGAEQHDAFDPIAVELVEGGAEAAEDLVIGCGSG